MMNESEWTTALEAVRRVVRGRRLPREVDYEDAVAETLLRVVRRRRPSGVSFAQFVHVAARYEVISYLRSGAGVRRTETELRKVGRSRLRQVSVGDFDCFDLPVKTEATAEVDVRDELQWILSRLAPRDAQTLWVCFLKRAARKAKEIAVDLDCLPWSVPYRRLRALHEARLSSLCDRSLRCV